MILSHKITLYPTIVQRRYFARAAGCDRFVWNLAVAEWERQYRSGEKPNGMKLRKEFNEQYRYAFPWMSELHRDARSEAFRRVDKAYRAFFNNPAQTKKPTFHKKGLKDSFYIANDKFALYADGKHVRLPRIGKIRMLESLRFAGKIMGAVVSRKADRWFISIQVDVGELQKVRTHGKITGVDLGVKTAATLSSGEQLEGPKPLKKRLKKLKRFSRRVSRKIKGSKNRFKAVRRLARVHAKIASIRKDWLHKLTTKLCRENQAVGIEDLNVKGMVKNRKLSRAISDIGFGEFRRQLEYKAKIYDTKIVVADRFFPSSKTCSQCGCVKEKLSLAERVFHCDQCGFEIDRDLNAARNLEKVAWGTRELTLVDSTACKATG